MGRFIEIERKFVLDLDHFPEVHDILLSDAFSTTTSLIQQFYEKKGVRYRRDGDVCLKEEKDSVNIDDVPYSIARERNMTITTGQFEGGWKTAKDRVTKLRYTSECKPGNDEDFGSTHTLVVDLFLSKHDWSQPDSSVPYALLAEVE